MQVEEWFRGRAHDGVDVEQTEPEAESSRVRVRTAAAGDGYFPKAGPAKLGNGTFLPDDLLARRGDGFRIVGRVSDVINVAGKKVNPAEVEADLLALAGVREAVVFGRESALRYEEVAACVVAESHVAEADLLRILPGAFQRLASAETNLFGRLKFRSTSAERQAGAIWPPICRNCTGGQSTARHSLRFQYPNKGVNANTILSFHSSAPSSSCVLSAVARPP